MKLYLKNKLDEFVTKVINDYYKVIERFEKGYFEVDYSILFEETMFLELLCIRNNLTDKEIYTIIDYFLTNDFKFKK